ncbi:hypothetical protein [Aureispira sp. CCB-E]|uniref:hypothetical protein n=1 Tax=Aureispira sp. CCB-E TaxID=3051121 RepID=UPI002868C8CF|nr:hypothetical protein [Aureispira sp. CCB-E]WMX15036.1 hypothetical protein QP953_01475 [Aureispira sp. CCB-E]
MDELKEYEATLKQYELELSQYWTQAQSADSPEGRQFSEDESRTLAEYRKRIDRLQKIIDAKKKELEGVDGSTRDKAIAYTAFKNKTWKWKLIDKDIRYHDFGAALEIDFNFGKEERGKQSYWILETVTPSPQSTTGLKLEVSTIKTKYYELKGNLAMSIEFQFKLSTADIKVSTTTGVGFSLGQDVKNSIGVALPVEGATVSAGNENTVSKGFTANKEWTKSQELPGSAATITRRFLCVNDGGKLNISLDYKNDVDPSAIDDPGMDPIGKADWEITAEDSSFIGSL